MDSLIARLGLGDPGWLDPAVAGALFLLTAVLAAVFHKLVFSLILRITARTPTDLDNRMVRATRLPMTAGIIVVGIYLSITLPLDLDAGSQSALDNAAGVVGLLLGIMAAASAVSQVFGWYIDSLDGSPSSRMSLRMLPLLRRITTAVIYAIGGLLILDLLTININPLVASLGIGGLAVALAIQPTLANLFAGTYVMTEGIIKPGDYIQLEGGTAGYVVEVSWRSTRLRTWGNNLVVVPNAKFAETIITNYNEPLSAVNVYLTCGVSYDSDLEQVERVSREVMVHTLENAPDAVKEYGAWFAFDKFDDSNVNFWLFIQAKDRLGSYVLQSDLIKGLHRRFKEEGIVINYPMRTLQFPDGWGPDALAGVNGVRGTGRRGRKQGSRRSGAGRMGTPVRPRSSRATQDVVVGGDAENLDRGEEGTPRS